jgi:hypothetical protein
VVAALLVAQCVVLAAIVGVSLWGAGHVPADARFRARAGTSGIDWTMGKRAALVTMPVVGGIVVLGSFAVRDSSDGTAAIPALGLGAMVVLFLAHRSSVRRAAR